MKYLKAFFMAFLYCSYVFAQTSPTELWNAKEYNEAGAGYLSPVPGVDKFGNLYSAMKETEIGLMGLRVVKYDNSGNKLWHYNTQPGNWEHYPTCFTVDSLGYSYVGIRYFYPFLPEKKGTTKLLKFSPNGDFLWSKNYLYNFEDTEILFKSEMDTVNGRLIVFGGHAHPDSINQNYYFVQAVDTSSGENIWKTKLVENPKFLYNMRVFQDKVMIFYVRVKPEGYYYVVAHLDLDGNLIEEYEHQYPSTFSQYTDYNHISQHGNIILGKRSSGYDIAKLNSHGDTLWTYSHSNGIIHTFNRVLDMKEDESQNVYCTGGVLYATGDTSADFTTTKFDVNGNVVWQNAYQTMAEPENDVYDQGENLEINKDYVVVLGYSYSINELKNLILIFDPDGPEPIYNFFLQDDSLRLFVKSAFVHNNKIFAQYGGDIIGQDNSGHIVTICVALPQITSTTDDNNRQVLNVYPNPTVDKVIISEIDNNYFNKALILDIEGKILGSHPLNGPTTEIDLKQYLSGTYIISLQGKNLTCNKKVVKM